MENYSDEFHLERINMIQNQLIPNQVYDKRILDAMESIPRHMFVETKWCPVAYLDDAVPSAKARKLLPPLVFAKMLSYSGIKDGSSVLDVGCGSAYSTAVLAQMVKQVIAIDNDPELLRQATHILNAIGIKNYICKQAELSDGDPDGQNFDVIIVNGILNSRGSSTPTALLSQLKRSGILMAIEQFGNTKLIVRYINMSGVTIKEELDLADAEVLL